MKKVIILGAGPLQIPAIKIIKELGYYLYAFDYDKDAPGFKFCDEHFLISTIDKNAVLEKARELKPDFVITSTSDAPVQTAAYVSEKLGLPTGISYKDSICATEKWAMRDRLKEFGVPIPLFYKCHNLNEFLDAVKALNYCCVVKPSDSAASRGVQFINNDNNLEEIYKGLLCYSRNNIVMVEELMLGKEVSVECLIVDRKAYILNITDKRVCELPYFVEIGHSEPSMLDKETKLAIKTVAVNAIEAINIVNGVSHVEIKITDEGPKIVELAARLGGDYITAMLVPLSTGYNLVANSVKLALGLDIDPIINNNNGSAIRFISARKGTIKEIFIPNNVYSTEGLVEIEMYKKVGDSTNDLKSSNDRIGHIIAKGKNAQDAINICEKILSNIMIVIEE